MKTVHSEGNRTAVFGGGCFWCTEAIFQMLKGVSKVESGYAGGTIEKPSYERVSSGDSGHAEVIRVTYDPSVISYDDLLTVFFGSHDPTTPNRQGADVGEQYRSIILYQSEEEKKEVKLFFSNSSIIEIDLSETAYNYPEAMLLTTKDGKYIVWN